MSIKNQKILVGALLFLLVSWGLYKNFSERNELTKNGITTTGKVIKLKYVNKSTYDLIFEFYVNNVKIQGSVFTSYFEIKNMKEKTYRVTYSKENPEINDIDIGEYNSYKKHRPFFSN